MATIRRNGTELYFDCRGDGPAILLSHGYSGTADMWDAQLAVLAAQYRVIVWDMRGHARSDSPAEVEAYSEAESLADMEAILDECGAQSAVIGGLALGGYLSLCFAAAAPQRTNALILVGTGPGWRNDAARDAWNAHAEGIAASLDERGLEALDEVIWGRHPLHRSAAGLARSARGALRQDDAHVIDSLPAIGVPTLIVVGEHDSDFIAPANYMTKKIPNATEVVISDAGHGCNMDAPDEFNRIALDFLASNVRTPDVDADR